MSRMVRVKREAPAAPAPTPVSEPAIPSVSRKSKGIPERCPTCNKKMNPDKGDIIYDCKDGVQRCEKCYKDWMKDQWKASGKQKKHNKSGGPRARFVIRVRKV